MSVGLQQTNKEEDMIQIIIILLFSVVMLLFSFMTYLVLSKTINNRGNTEFVGEVKLFKVLHIKIKTKHKSNKK